MRKIFIRSSLVFFWILLIFTALYWPKWHILPFEENTINIFAWGDILDPDVIKSFQEETGINVNLNYYSSNEELIVKLKATRGEGYDLIIPSDYAVKVLVHEELLKELDHEKLHFWNVLNPALLDHFFDPENRYSIPFEWEIYGLGIDKDFFAKYPREPSWDMVFDLKSMNYKITMINDPIEAVQFASYFMHGPLPSLNAEQTSQVTDLLIRQKAWVTAYANFRGDYFLATKNCAVVIASSSYIWRTMRMFDFVNFVIPKEGTFITIENLCIPIASQKEKHVYRFINYLYRPQSIVSHYNTYGFFPATLHAIDLLNTDPQAEQLMRSTEEDFQKYHFTRTILPQEELRDIWVEVKSGSL